MRTQGPPSCCPAAVVQTQLSEQRASPRCCWHRDADTKHIRAKWIHRVWNPRMEGSTSALQKHKQHRREVKASRTTRSSTQGRLLLALTHGPRWTRCILTWKRGAGTCSCSSSDLLSLPVTFRNPQCPHRLFIFQNQKTCNKSGAKHLCCPFSAALGQARRDFTAGPKADRYLVSRYLVSHYLVSLKEAKDLEQMYLEGLGKALHAHQAITNIKLTSETWTTSQTSTPRYLQSAHYTATFYFYLDSLCFLVTLSAVYFSCSCLYSSPKSIYWRKQ